MPEWLKWILGIGYFLSILIAAKVLFLWVKKEEEYTYIVKHHGKPIARGKNGKKDKMSPR